MSVFFGFFLNLFVNCLKVATVTRWPPFIRRSLHNGPPDGHVRTRLASGRLPGGHYQGRDGTINNKSPPGILPQPAAAPRPRGLWAHPVRTGQGPS